MSRLADELAAVHRTLAAHAPLAIRQLNDIGGMLGLPRMTGPRVVLPPEVG